MLVGAGVLRPDTHDRRPSGSGQLSKIRLGPELGTSAPSDLKAGEPCRGSAACRFCKHYRSCRSRSPGNRAFTQLHATDLREFQTISIGRSRCSAYLTSRTHRRRATMAGTGFSNTGGGDRTHTGITAQRILSAHCGRIGVAWPLVVPNSYQIRRLPILAPSSPAR